MSSLLQYIKIINQKIAADDIWVPYQLSASIEPESFSLLPASAYQSLLPSNSQPFYTSRQIVGLQTCFNVVSCFPCRDIPIARNRPSSLGSLIFRATCLTHSPYRFSSLHIQYVLGFQTLTKTHTQATGQVLLILSSLPPGMDKEKAGAECKPTSVLFVVPIQSHLLQRFQPHWD